MNKPTGVYGHTVRSTYSPKIRSASHGESISLAKQMDQGYSYFLPYLPMAMLPGLPSLVAEYAENRKQDVTIIRWQLKNQLVPKLFETKDMDTSQLFGLSENVGPDFYDFVNGVVYDGRPVVPPAHLVIGRTEIAEPLLEDRTNAKAASQLDRLQVHVMAVNTVDALYSLVPDPTGTFYRVAKDPTGGDPKIQTYLENYGKVRS